MFAFLNNLFGKTRTVRQTRSYRPSFDDLESRQLMSVSSTAIHAVAAPGCRPGQRLLLRQQAPTRRQRPRAAQNVRNTPHGIERSAPGWTPSARRMSSSRRATSRSGNGTKGTGRRCSAPPMPPRASPRWTATAPTPSTATARCTNSTVDAWSKVPGSSKVTAIDAITDGRGNDAVFALNSNGTFGEYFGGHFDNCCPPTTASAASRPTSAPSAPPPSQRRRHRLRSLSWTPSGRSRPTSVSTKSI